MKNVKLLLSRRGIGKKFAIDPRMETNDEGEITMKIVVEHIKGLEAGSGNNVWV